jgi:methionine-S-sulfoxide reductase
MDERQWPTPIMPVDDDTGLAMYHGTGLLDPALRHNDKIELVINLPENKMPGKKLEKATFGAGCFWHVEDAFMNVPGVVSTEVGFEGGHTENPSYKDVCTHTTGHAEVTEVTYDPSKVSYEDLLNVFWNIHDPTTPNRQGPDIGGQYRSVIFFHDKEQEETAKASKEKMEKSGKFRRPIVTQIVPAQKFWRAEEYHQKYFQKTGQRACGI